MALDLFGPTVADGGVTVRPAETRTHGSSDTFWRDCSAPDVDDGTKLTASFFNQCLEIWRKLARGNGQTTVGAVDVVTESNSDDTILLKAVQHLIQRGQPSWAIDTGSQNVVVVAPTPAIAEYKAGMEMNVKIAASCTGPSTINVSAKGAVAIKRLDGGDLQLADMRGGMIARLVYDGTFWQLTNSQQSVIKVLTANTTLYVNGTTGHDVNFDGSQATVVGVKGPFKTISRAVTEAFKFGPSATYGVTILVADGTYLEGVGTPSIPGPAITIDGNAGVPANVLVNSTGISNTFTVTGPNVLVIKNLKWQCSTAQMAGVCATGAGASLTTMNTESGPCSTWCFLANGLGSIVVGGAHKFTASVGEAFSAYRNGTVNFAGGFALTISTPITVNVFARASAGGQIEVPATSTPTFVNPGNVTGQRYNAILNSVINTQGAGINYFPGTTAGATSSGGQYA